MVYDPNQKPCETTQRMALGDMPEGAEKRFSEHVAEEIRAGRFELGEGYFDKGWMSSPDAGLYRYDRNDSYSVANYDKKVFGLIVEMGWRWFKRVPYVRLTRGRKDITDLLAPFEQDLLIAAYREGEQIWKAKQIEKQREAEAKRQRAAWWP